MMGAGLAMFFGRIFEPVSFFFLLFIFFTYFSGYLYTKYQRQRGILRKVIVLNFITLALGWLFLWKYGTLCKGIKWSLIIIMGILYNSRFLVFFIRKVPLLKVFYVGLVWALVSVWLPFTKVNLGAVLAVILYISALVLPFDIRDQNQDEVLTFPKWIGERNTKVLAYILLLMSVLLVFISLENVYAYCFCGAVMIAMLLIYFATPYRHELYFSFLLESCSGLPFLFLTLWQYLF